MHPIKKAITLDKESPIFRMKGFNKFSKVDINNNLSLYILACGKSLASIDSSIDKTRLSLTLLDTGYLDSIASEGQSKSTYIEMLVENSIIRVQSIYDRVLIFTNSILDLGISDESINHNLLVTNKNVKKFSLEGKLKAINKACDEYRFIRNTVIHHNRYTEEEFNQLIFIIDADQSSKEAGKSQLMPIEKLNAMTQDYLDIKKEYLGKYLDGIENKLFALYDAILPVYDHYKDKIRAK